MFWCSVFVFHFCVGFVSVLFALFLFRCWIVFGVGSCFVFVFVFFCFFCCCPLFVFFLFFGGFKSQVRWPKGPPHLALNPPCFICFVFFVFFYLFCFLCFFFVFVFFVFVFFVFVFFCFVFFLGWV